MSNCRATFTFLDTLRSKTAGAVLPGADIDVLSKLGLIRVFSSEEYDRLSRDVGGLASARDAILKDGADRARISEALVNDSHRTHSILFSFEGASRRAEAEAQVSRDAQDLQAVDADLQRQEQIFQELSVQRTLLDAAAPLGDGRAALTGLGAIALRDLGLALYRVDDAEFSAYWASAQQVDHELDAIANQSAGYASGLIQGIPDAGRSNLWAVAVGLSKTDGAPTAKVPRFLSAYQAVGRLATNAENRLMAAEILSALGPSAEVNLPALTELDRAVRSAGVPSESSLGVASILQMGRRADGTYATANLAGFLQVTKSYESAGLLAVVNEDPATLTGKFNAARQVFRGWGYEPSEDIDLSAAYLAASDLPIDGVGTKLAIIARGLTTYLRYPLVGAAILTSIPVLEANETLGLLEKAYESIGRRTGPMAPPELICLAVRMLHGIHVASPGDLDPTAAPPPPPPPTVARYYGGPRFFFVPLFVAHGFYYSTYSGIGGAHPGHVHAWGGFAG